MIPNTSRALSAAARIELVRNVLRAWTPQDFRSLTTFLHPEFVFELPYFPAQNLSGLDNYMAALELFVPTLTQLDLTMVEAFEIAGSDMIVAEYRSHAEFVDGRPPYKNHYIGFFDFDDGKLSLWREFLNSIILATSFPDSDIVAAEHGARTSR